MTVFLEAAVNSLLVGAGSAAVAGAGGMAMAWLVARTDLPGGRRLAGLLALPYALPPYLLAMAWVVLGNPGVGLLRRWLPGGGSYGYWGMTLVLASASFALPFLEVKAGFERMDPALEEAARISGAGPWRIFRDISLPLLWPCWLNGLCLAFLSALSAFGVPALLGLPVRKFVLTTLIYSELKVGGSAGLARGLRLSLVLAGIAGVVLLASGWLNRVQNRRSGPIMGGKASRVSRVRLGPWSAPAAACAWGLFILAVVLPWIALGLSALAPVAGKYSPALWTSKNIVYVLKLPDFRQALVNSLLLTLVSASGIAALGFLLAFAAVRRGRRWAQVAIESLGIPFALPGTMLALLIIMLAGGLGLPPLAGLVLAYSLKYAAVGARSMAQAMRQVDPALEEAARVSGAKTSLLLWTIWAPLLKSTLAACWILAALPIFTELTMSVLLTGPGAATMGTVLFELQEYADQPSAAALAWLLLSVAIAGSLLSRPGEAAA